jgi:hypothetical protein
MKYFLHNFHCIYCLFGVADPDPHHFGKLDPDPHQSENQDPEPDPHQSEKVELSWIIGGSKAGKNVWKDPDPNQTER